MSPIYGLTTYEPSKYAQECSSCRKPISRGELYFRVCFPGLSLRRLCLDCPPSRPEVAIAAYERKLARSRRFRANGGRLARPSEIQHAPDYALSPEKTA